VGDDLVAALADRGHHLRGVFVDQAVGVVRRRQLQLIEELEQPPDADAVAVVAPGIVAMRLRLAGLRGVVTEAGAECEPLDVRRDDEGESLAARPAVVAPLRQRDEVVAAVLGKERLQRLISSA
jgi:hypothetical protein